METLFTIMFAVLIVLLLLTFVLYIVAQFLYGLGLSVQVLAGIFGQDANSKAG